MTKASYSSDFMKIMQERGFIHQATDAEGLDKQLAKERVTAYIGFDATADSLHVGSLMQIMVLRWLQKPGTNRSCSWGGGTTKVGDPSGKDEARKLLNDADITRNITGIGAIFEQFLKFGTGPQDAVMVNNAEWLDSLNYIEFLRKFGRYFSVNRMLTQESVKLRLEREQNLSFLEFNYMILQAYDFVELNSRYGVSLQIGGSDQWGNIIMGIDLARRIDARNAIHSRTAEKTKGIKVVEVQPMIQSKRTDPRDYETGTFMNYLGNEGGRNLFGLTTPLLATASGAKMGKTAAGAVWLNKSLLSPYDYWQFWRNTEDADVGRFLKLFTDLPMAEIAKLEKLKGAEINEAKKILANEATKLCHGSHAAKQAAETAQKLFEQGTLAEDMPVHTMKTSELGKGVAAYELFRLAGLADSGGEARRLIRGGGARINDKKVDDENDLISLPQFGDDKQLKLSAGKKKHVLVKIK